MSRIRAGVALLETSAYAAAGALALSLLHLPAGGLLGAMLAVAAASLAGRPMGAPHLVQSAVFILMGSSVGAAATPAALASVLKWPVSLALLVAGTLAMYAAGYAVFRRVAGWDRPTALYAASPGALSAVMVMAQGDGAVMSRVATAQVLRLAALTCAAPLILSQLALQAPAPAAAAHGPLAWLLFAAAVILGWKAAARLRWPSPAFLGPMAVSGALHLGGVLALATPQPVLMAASAGVGALVGARFRGVAPRELLRYFPPAALSFSAMGVLGVAAGLFAAHLSGVSPAAGLLAFAPGSMDVLIAMSLAMHASPAYVAAHHTVRLLLLLALVPLVTRRRVDAVPVSEAE